MTKDRRVQDEVYEYLANSEHPSTACLINYRSLHSQSVVCSPRKPEVSGAAGSTEVR